MPSSRTPLLLIASVGVLLGVVGCSSSSEVSSSSTSSGSAPAPGSTSAPGSTAASGTSVAAEPCPVEPLKVVVSVDQWGDVVEQLGGECTEVTTIITGSSGDPHDYEPTPADTAAFSDAQLVVVNGLDYDHWASDIVGTMTPAPAVVDGGEVVGLEEGANPHIWYSPTYVDEVSSAVTTELTKLAPEAATYFEDQATAWDEALQPYRDEIEAVTAVADGKSFGSTESVFDYMADAVGLENATPQGYQNAAANESDPAPGDIAEFQTALNDGSMKVLIFNTQTEGAIPEQIRQTAEDASVPVVEVTETVPSGSSFVEWQVSQLEQLRAALG